MPRLNQKGLAPIALIIMLLAGVALGTYLVQNRTNLLPKACELDSEGQCSGGSEEPDDDEGNSDNGNGNREGTSGDGSGGDNPDKGSTGSGGCPEWAIPVDGGCRDTRLNDQTSGGQPNLGDEEGLSPSKGQTTELKNCDAIVNSDSARTICESENVKISSKNNDVCARDKVTYCDSSKAIRKTGGYFDGKNCVFDFYEISEKNSECSSDKGAKDGNVVSISAQEAAAKDIERSINQGQGEPGDSSICRSASVCQGGKKVLKSSVDDPNKEGGCIENSYNTNETAECSLADGEAKPDGTIIGGDEKTDTALKLFSLGQQRIVLKQQIDDARKLYDPQGQKSADDPMIKAFAQAQSFLDGAKAKFDSCFNGGEQSKEACQAVAEIDQTKAVMASRVALLKAAKAGIAGIRVKADLAVGGTTNSLMIARPNDGKGSFSRIFLITDANKKVNYVVRNSDGTLVPANPNDLKKYNLTQGQAASEISTLFADRFKRAECGVNGTCPTTGSTNIQSQPQSVQPAAPANPGSAPQPAAQTQDRPYVYDVKRDSEADPNCSVEKTCKFWTNQQKNDGIVIYTGTSDAVITLFVPSGQQLTMTVSQKPNISTPLELDSYLRNLVTNNSEFSSFWDKYNQAGGKIQKPKVNFTLPRL